MLSLRRLKGIFHSTFKFSSCRDADVRCPNHFMCCFYCVENSQPEACRVWGGWCQYWDSGTVPWADSTVRLGKCLPSSSFADRATLRVCLLVVLDVLSVFQSPRFNSFFSGKTFFLGAYSYIPHSGFPKVLWECRMGTVISKSGRENEQLRRVYASIASERQLCTPEQS